MEETRKRFGQTQTAIWVGAGLWFSASLCMSSHLWLSADYRLELEVIGFPGSTMNDSARWFRSRFLQYLAFGFFVALILYKRIAKPRQLRLEMHSLVVFAGIGTGIAWPNLLLPNSWTDQSGEGLIRILAELPRIAPTLGWIVLAFAVYAAAYFYVFKPLLNREAQIQRERDQSK